MLRPFLLLSLARLLAGALAGWTGRHLLYRLSKNSGLRLDLVARSAAVFAVVFGGSGHGGSPWVQNGPSQGLIERGVAATHRDWGFTAKKNPPVRAGPSDR